MFQMYVERSGMYGCVLASKTGGWSGLGSCGRGVSLAVSRNTVDWTSADPWSFFMLLV